VSHSYYVASVFTLMRKYTLGKVSEEAVLHNRGTTSGFSAGLRKTTTDLSWYSGRPGRDSERVQIYSISPTPAYSL